MWKLKEKKMKSESDQMKELEDIEARIRNQTDTMDALIMKWAATIDSVDSRQRKLKIEFTKLKDELYNHIKSMNDELLLQKEDNINLEDNVLEKVQERISKAIQYGEEIEVLHKKAEALCKIDFSQIESHFAMLIQNAKIGIKDEADLRINDILNLEKKFLEGMTKDESKKNEI